MESPGPYIGIVKWNIDQTCAGRLQVFIPDLGVADENKPTSWYTVGYASPFRGKTPVSQASSGVDEESSSQSYGFWFVPPDVGVRVICFFMNADPAQGYWTACVNDPQDSYMTPGIATSSVFKWDPALANQSILRKYIELADGQLPSTLPVSEALVSATSVKPDNLFSIPRFPHIYQSMRLGIQGLCFDTIRGPVSSSSNRESPSQVYGISTPGRHWMMANATASQQFLSSDTDTATKKLEKHFRTGGHQFVMDDGSTDGLDQMIRIRSTHGNMIMLDDTNEQIYIVNARGTAWIELSPSGRIDIYAENDFSVRSKGNLNFHSERDFNIHARGNINVKSEKISNWQSQGNLNLKTSATATVFSQGNMNIGTQQTLGMSAQTNINAESRQDTNWKSKNYKLLATAGATLFGQGSVNIGAAGSLNVYSTASLSLSSTGKVVISGTPLLENTGSGTPVTAPTITPATVTAPADIPLVSHPATAQVSGKQTWWTGVNFQSIVSRAPDHEPWKNHEKYSVKSAPPPSTSS